MAKQDWQKIWSEYKVDVAQDKARLSQELHTIRWHAMQRIINDHFGSIAKTHTIEIGAGLGDFSLLLNWEGADTTLADYSEEAIAKAKARFRAHRAKAHFIQANMLQVPASITGKFDISFSLGVAEHFEDDERYQLIAAHAQVLRAGGLTFISVPYRYSFVYRIWMAQHKRRATWQYGLEIPFSKRELKQFAERAGFTTLGIIQSSFWADTQNFFPQLRVKKFFGRKIDKKSLMDIFGYAIIYVGKK